MTHKIQTVAKAFGTFNSPDTGSILYVDPSHSDEAHHSPLLTREEARVAFERGLIEDPDGAKEATADQIDDEARDPNALATVAVERVAEVAQIDADASDLPSALDSRQTTAWEKPDTVLGGVEGTDDSDEDAAPAPAAKPGRKPKATDA